MCCAIAVAWEEDELPQKPCLPVGLHRQMNTDTMGLVGWWAVSARGSHTSTQRLVRCVLHGPYKPRTPMRIVVSARRKVKLALPSSHAALGVRRSEERRC